MITLTLSLLLTGTPMEDLQRQSNQWNRQQTEQNSRFKQRNDDLQNYYNSRQQIQNNSIYNSQPAPKNPYYKSPFDK